MTTTKRASKPKPAFDSDPAELAKHLRVASADALAGTREAAETVVALAIQAHVPVFIYSEPGTGKCLGRGTLVMRYDGRRVPVEKVAVGDLLMGPDSAPRRVLATTSGSGPLYRIVPIKGEPWVCNDAHVLTLVRSARHADRSEPGGEVFDVPLNDYLRLPAAVKTHAKLFQPEHVDFPATDDQRPVTPYFVGVWLGDGTKNLRCVAITKPDAEIEQTCREEAARFGLRVRVDRSSSRTCPTYFLAHDQEEEGRWLVNPLLDAMRTLMSDRLGVPDSYLYGPREVREQVLAGLLDTDGSVSGGGYEIVQKSVTIADDLSFLARSLGCRVTRSVKTVNGEDYQRLFITGASLTDLPLRIARKVAPPRRQKKNPLRTGFSVESLGDGEYFGFSLDGDHRFLLGDFTVTHNSATTRSITDDLNETLYTIMLSTREPTDQGGLPAIFEDKGEKLVRLIAPGWARDLIRAKRGVVLFDEITNATTATMNSGLRVVQEGVVGDGEKLPADTSFVLAGNPPETNVGAADLTAGMANRCLHVEWPFEYQRWRVGMLTRWAATSRPKVTLLPPKWRDQIPAMAALVVAFLDTQSDLAQKQPMDVVDQGKAWPSGRTWDLTALMLAAANAAGHDPKSMVGKLIVRGLVGEAAQTQWTSWVANMDLPSTEFVLANADTFEMPPRQDQVMTILTGVVRYVAENRSLDTYMRAWTVANRVLRDEPSLAISAVRDLGALMPPGADQKSGTPFHEGLILSKDHLRRSGSDYGSART